MIAFAFGFLLVDVFHDSIMLTGLSFLELLKLHVNSMEIALFSFLVIGLIVAASSILKGIEHDRKAELQSYNAILQSLIDSTDDATLISDKYALPVLWNKAYASIMKEALNIDMREGLQPHKQLKDEKLIAWWDDLHKRVLSGESFRIEYSHDFEKDDIRHYEISYNPIFEDGEISGFSEFTRDITDRKMAMKMIERSENKYRTLLNNIPQKIFYKDINSVYILCNESYAKDLNIEPSEVIGKTDYDFYPKELAEKYRTDDKEIMESCKMLEIEENYFVDGKEMTVNTLKAPMFDESRKTVGIFGVFWDITERKKMEETLQNAHDELEIRVQERTAELEKANEELQFEIESRKKTEESLVSNEKRFRAAATTTADLIWEGDVRVDILRWHGDIDTILGYEQNEFPRTVS
jgi:PAS domain S-box-containing protein